jgi:acyl-CoA reductase-like NAD-dependent aldehyde dehydrogenase
MLTVFNPATGRPIREVQTDTVASVVEKVARARESSREWSRAPFSHRRDRVARFFALLGEERDRLAHLLTSEVGKPISQSRSELDAMPARGAYFLDRTERVIADEVVQAQRLAAPGRGGSPATEERICYEPLGVVANISAWNYPYFVGSNVFVPALLTGNTVLFKPSEYSTLTGLAIAELMHRAGVPEDVFVPVVGGGEVGAALVEAPVDGIYFTGSYPTGLRIARAAAGRMIPVQLELGGKDPVYIADDVDAATAAAAMAEGAFYNNGQSCCAVERIYVHRSIADRFTDELCARVEALVVGDPLDDDTFIGPVTREAQLRVLEQQIADAVERGGVVRCGGKRADREGWYFEPTVVAGANHQMKLMREESFGPVIGVQPVGDDHEAVALMNDTEFGLTAGVYTGDRDRAERLLAEVDSGTAYWNCCDRVSPRLPWTGRRHSGIGSTLSEAGIRAFVRPKAYHLRRPAE